VLQLMAPLAEQLEIPVLVVAPIAIPMMDTPLSPLGTQEILVAALTIPAPFSNLSTATSKVADASLELTIILPTRVRHTFTDPNLPDAELHAILQRAGSTVLFDPLDPTRWAEESARPCRREGISTPLALFQVEAFCHSFSLSSGLPQRGIP